MKKFIVTMACVATFFAAAVQVEAAQTSQNQVSVQAHTDWQSHVCQSIENKYNQVIEGAQMCYVDEHCQVLWGQCGQGLGGCYEITNITVSQEHLDYLGDLYWENGCTGAVCSCAMLNFTAVCEQGQCVAEQIPPEPTCDDLSGYNFGLCEMIMGWAVVDGTCQVVSGCGSEYIGFFETQEECAANCLGGPRPGVCDDGSPLMCRMMEPVCADWEILAIKNGCYECVNAITCEPWGVPGCNSNADCAAGETCAYCATSSCYVCDDCVAACI